MNLVFTNSLFVHSLELFAKFCRLEFIQNKAIKYHLFRYMVLQSYDIASQLQYAKQKQLPLPICVTKIFDIS